MDGTVKALDVLLQAAEEVTMREAGEKAATEGQRAPAWQQGHLDGKTKHEYQKARSVSAKARAAITQLNTGQDPGTSMALREFSAKHPGAITSDIPGATRHALVLALEAEGRKATTQAKTLLATHERRTALRALKRENWELTHDKKRSTGGFFRTVNESP